jgi:chorismate mutase
VSTVGGEVERLRDAIAELDRRLVDLIVERIHLAQEIGVAKQRAGIPTLDPAREAAVVRAAAERARTSGLNDEGVRDLYWRLIALCRGAQHPKGEP